MLISLLLSLKQTEIILNHHNSPLIQIESQAETPQLTIPTQTSFNNLKLPPPTPSKIPIKTIPSTPILKATAYLAQDLNTGYIIYSKNDTQKLPMASLTKLMTVILAIENLDINQSITITKASTELEGSNMKLRVGESISIKNLIYATLINSANDAAHALALHHSGSIEEFTKAMNKKATEIGLINTNFKNPTGFDEENHYSTIEDLSKLANYAFKKKLIREIVIQPKVEVTSTDGKITHTLKNTNQLLNTYLKVKGLKTGTTDLAGQCLITIFELPNGANIMIILLNSPNRFLETKIFAEWITQSFIWQ